jgi:hypothetical protein
VGERIRISRCNCAGEGGKHEEVCTFRLSMEAICPDCWGYQHCCWRERRRRMGFWARIREAIVAPP